MQPTQRHLSALTSLALLVMVATVACSSRTDSTVTLTGAEPSVDGVVAPDDASAPVGGSVVPPVAPEAFAGAASSADGRSSTTRSVTRPDAGSGQTGSGQTGSGQADSGQSSAALDEVDELLASGDVCGVYRALSELPLDAISTERFAAQLRRIRDIMLASEGIAPSDVHDDWVIVADATAEVVESLERDPGAMAQAAEAYEEADYLAAQERVDAWVDANCA